MSLPPGVRKELALRLLDDPDQAFDTAAEDRLHTEAAAAFDALKADPSRDPCRDGACSFRVQVGRPFMTGRINYTPEARKQPNESDDWIAKAASAENAQSSWRRSSTTSTAS